MPCDVDVSRPIAEGSWHRDVCDASAPEGAISLRARVGGCASGHAGGCPLSLRKSGEGRIQSGEVRVSTLEATVQAWRCRVAHARTKLVLTAGCGASSILTGPGCHGASLSRECCHSALDTSGWRLPVRSSQPRLGRFELTVVKKGIPASWHPDWHWQLPVTRRARDRPVGDAAAWARPRHRCRAGPGPAPARRRGPGQGAPLQVAGSLGRFRVRCVAPPARCAAFASL